MGIIEMLQIENSDYKMDIFQNNVCNLQAVNGQQCVIMKTCLCDKIRTQVKRKWFQIFW